MPGPISWWLESGGGSGDGHPSVHSEVAKLVSILGLLDFNFIHKPEPKHDLTFIHCEQWPAQYRSLWCELFFISPCSKNAALETFSPTTMRNIAGGRAVIALNSCIFSNSRLFVADG